MDETDWVRYRSGALSMRGWLTAHSLAYRYYLTLLFHLRLSDRVPLLRDLNANIDQLGFLPRKTVYSSDVRGPDSKDLPTPDAIEALSGSIRQLARLTSENGVQLLLVEVPTPETISSESSAAGRRAVDAFEASAPDGVPFRRVSPADVPADGFADLTHLNAVGAAAFSQRLGRWLAEVHKERISTTETRRHGELGVEMPSRYPFS